MQWNQWWNYYYHSTLLKLEKYHLLDMLHTRHNSFVLYVVVIINQESASHHSCSVGELHLNTQLVHFVLFCHFRGKRPLLTKHLSVIQTFFTTFWTQRYIDGSSSWRTCRNTFQNLYSDVYYRHILYFEAIGTSLVPRPSPAPVFDCLQYAKTEPEGLVNLTTWSLPRVTSQILDMETYSHLYLQLQRTWRNKTSSSRETSPTSRT